MENIKFKCYYVLGIIFGGVLCIVPCLVSLLTSLIYRITKSDWSKTISITAMKMLLVIAHAGDDTIDFTKAFEQEGVIVDED